MGFLPVILMGAYRCTSTILVYVLMHTRCTLLTYFYLLFLALPRFVLTFLALSFRVFCCLALSCLVLSCVVLSCLTVCCLLVLLIIFPMYFCV